MITPVAINNISWRYYIIYAAIAACVLVSVYFFFPGTMGRNLEEIGPVFKDSPSVWSTVKFVKGRPIAMPQEYIREEKVDHVEGEESSTEERWTI